MTARSTSGRRVGGCEEWLLGLLGYILVLFITLITDNVVAVQVDLAVANASAANAADIGIAENFAQI